LKYFMSDSASSEGFSVSRRSFIKAFGTSAAVAATAQVQAVAAELEKVNAEKIVGPQAVPITLQVNGKPLKLEVEPRVTLLEALRNHASFTGAKEVCDRATCGACTVLIDDKPVYSCSTLAIEAQGKQITTVEGLAENGKLSKVQQAFIEQDGLMCGFCTPGFVVSITALLKRNPHPTADDVKHACAGNLCRCGTQPRVLQAALKAAGVNVTSKTEVISYAKLA
ncbi:MAG TPA: (2Fe-2S)-binding protein, partial [Candidatus Paceibacterota bacterium]|nr:(2Fe-2S)-binding protein [Candidatus Paceibacterota bacterium]